MSNPTQNPWQPPPVAPAPDEEENQSWAVTLTQFVFIPLGIVALCVGLFYGLRWLTYEPRSVKTYLDSLRQSTGAKQAQTAQHLFDYIQQSKRWQGFYDLTTTVSGKISSSATDETVRQSEIRENQKAFRTQYPNFTPTILAAFENLRAQSPRSEDDKLTLRYLAQLMGLVGDTAATSALVAALKDEDNAVVTHATLALALIGDEAALPSLTLLVREHNDPVARRTGALALALLGKPDAITALKRALEDGDEMVRMQAAIGLARCGSVDGRAQLERMLDRKWISALGDTSSGEKLALTPEQQTQIRVVAIQAVATLGLHKEQEIAKRLTVISTDGSEPTRVRDAAIKATKT